LTKIVESVIIDRPVDEVWNFSLDLANVPKWYTAIQEMRPTSTGPPGVGSTWEVVRKDKMVIPQKCIEYEPNRKFSFIITSGPARGTTVSYSTEQIEGKTKFTVAADYKVSGYYKLLAPFLIRGQKKEGIASNENLKRIMESQVKASA
jgi:uncharacterized membrane protein